MSTIVAALEEATETLRLRSQHVLEKDGVDDCSCQPATKAFDFLSPLVVDMN